VYGERSQYTIVAVEPQAGGTEWYRRVWDRIVSLSPIAGAKLEGCDRFLTLLSYPPAPQLVRYDGHRWDTVSLLPVIDVWRDTISPQFQYYGERPQQWVWNGASVFVWSWYTNGWWSADSGKTWEIVRFDSIGVVYQSRGRTSRDRYALFRRILDSRGARSFGWTPVREKLSMSAFLIPFVPSL